ncbi:MAG TPA: AAA family ATPase, partial [Thermomicrobiales bacterium]|nr:AAA family ATPase [Thermomicrobiales bacterium]
MRDAINLGSDAAPAAALVGRDRERALLREHLAAALAGRGSLVLIGGEAGIGKTALAEATLAEAVGRGALALVGRCYDLSETPPYGPWAEAFARAPRADVPPPPDLAGGAGTGSQAALFAAVRDYLAALAARRPLVLLLDDLHWADPGSLDLLRVLARGLAGTPLLLLATYRRDELTRRHPLYALLPLLVREARAARLDLRPLDEAGLRALVAGYALPPEDEAPLVAYLRERSEGNPFFAGELLRALAEEGGLRRAGAAWDLGDLGAVGVPPLLRQVIDARVDRLGEETRELLVAAAVVGQEVPLALWRAVARADEDALLAVMERAAEARLLVETPGGDGVRFAHALIREALYEGMLGPRRRALHRRVAGALAAGPAPDPDAVAHHFQRAGDERAIEWLVAAGERAVRAHAYQTATARFEAALAWLEEGGDPAERAWLLFRLGVVWRSADPRRAVAALDAALALAADDAALAALAVVYRGLALAMHGDQPRGLAGIEAGAAALRALAPEERARLRGRGPVAGLPLAALDPRGNLAVRLAEAGRLGEAVALGETVLAEPRAPAEEAGPLLRDTHFGLAHAQALLGRPAEAARAYAEARERNRAAGAPLGAYLAAGQELEFVTLPYRADDPAAWRRLGALAETLWGRTGEAAALGVPGVAARLPLLIHEGEWGAARELAELAYRRFPPLWRHWAARHLGILARAQGDPAVARGVVATWLPSGPTTPPGTKALIFAVDLMRLAAALALDAGDLPAARAWLEAHDRWLAWSGAVLGRAEGALGWAAYHRVAGDLTRAREYAAAALAHASEPRQPLALLAAHRLLGELATAAGQHDEAASYLDEALALADACAAPYERALSLLATAELRAAT